VKFAVEVSGADASAVKEEIADQNVRLQQTRIASSTGIDSVQLFIDCAAIIVPTIATILAAYISRGGTVVIIKDGKRRKVECIDEILEEIDPPPNPARRKQPPKDSPE
jgi:hypothetical protein